MGKISPGSNSAKKTSYLTSKTDKRTISITDASERNNFWGISCYWNTTGFAPISQTVAKGPDLSSYLEELLTIEASLAQLLHSVNCGAIGPNVIFFSHSQGALQALANIRSQSGRFFISNICQQTRLINASGQTSVSIQWSPGYAKISGNEKAHRLAKLASKPNSVMSLYQRACPLPLVTAIEQGLVLHRAKSDNLARFPNGRFIKSFDKVLPSPHSQALYKGKTKSQASTLWQLRTGINRLNSYL